MVVPEDDETPVEVVPADVVPVAAFDRDEVADTKVDMVLAAEEVLEAPISRVEALAGGPFAGSYAINVPKDRANPKDVPLTTNLSSDELTEKPKTEANAGICSNGANLILK